MGLMSYLHRQLLRRGVLDELLPHESDPGSGDKPERDAAKAEIRIRAAKERETRKEVADAIRRLKDLDNKNHYGESLRRAFGGS